MRKEYWFLILSGLFSGTITPGGHFLMDSGLSMYEVSFFRSLLAFFIILPVVLGRPRYMIRRDKIPFYTLYGLVGGFLEIMMFSGIALGVPVAVVVLLLYTQPVWTIFIGRFTLGERITGAKLAAVILGLLGLVLLLRSWEAGSGGSFAGIVCALLSGVLLAFWVILGKKSTMLRQHYITTTFGWWGFTSLWLLVLWPAMNLLTGDKRLVELSFNFSPYIWTSLIVFAFLSGVISLLLFFRGLRGVSASVAGIILLLEPLSATALAWLFFSQSLGFYIILGGLFILLSNYLVIRKHGSEVHAF